MKLQEILDRIQNVLYQGVDTESQDLVTDRYLKPSPKSLIRKFNVKGLRP